MKRVLLLLALIPAPALAADPDVILVQGTRGAQATPTRQGFTHTGGGIIDVQQPAPDTLVITLAGVAVAGAHPCKDSVANLLFELTQDVEVRILKKGVKRARLSLEARQIGLLRSHECGKGGARISCAAQASVTSGPTPLVSVQLPERGVAGGENLSVNDHTGPCEVVVGPGKFVLHQRFGIEAVHPRGLLPCKAASVEFAPDPALNPLWISSKEPFRGTAKKDYGFQVILKISAEEK